MMPDCEFFFLWRHVCRGTDGFEMGFRKENQLKQKKKEAEEKANAVRRMYVCPVLCEFNSESIRLFFLLTWMNSDLRWLLPCFWHTTRPLYHPIVFSSIPILSISVCR